MQISRRPRLFRPTLVSIALATALHAGSAWAVEPFVLKDIRVEGLQRTDPGTVFASLPFRIGETYTDEKGAAALRALFATGLFKDVRLEVNGDVLVVVVEERPTVADVDFVGPLCESSDTLGRDRTIPRPQVGDLFAVLDTGAYGSVMASNYNRRLIPAEVMVEDGEARVIRRRQSLDDVLALEV